MEGGCGLGKDVSDSNSGRGEDSGGDVFCSRMENENSGREGEEIKGFKVKQINTCKKEGSRKENGMVEELKQWFM